MSKEPLVSIILQTFNRRNLLESALESAKNQTYKNIEILVGDNHSQDGTEEYMREEEKKDSRIRYFRHKKNIRMAGNANFLLDKMEGEFFVFLNDDDWLDLDYVEKSIRCIKNKPNYSMVCPSTVLYQRINNIDNCTGKYCMVANLEQPLVFDRLIEYLKFQDLIEMSSGCFRTSVIREIKAIEGQYIQERFAEDIILIMKYLVKGKCRVLENTHMNKRDDGFSRRLETADTVYSFENINYKNHLKKRCKIYSKILLEDKYFFSVLSESELKKLSKKIYFSLLYYYARGVFSFRRCKWKISNLCRFFYNYRLYRA